MSVMNFMMHVAYKYNIVDQPMIAIYHHTAWLQNMNFHFKLNGFQFPGNFAQYGKLESYATELYYIYMQLVCCEIPQTTTVFQFPLYTVPLSAVCIVTTGM